MSGDYQEEATELARTWQGLVVPVDDEEAERRRERRIVPSLGDAIVRGSQKRQRDRTRGRVLRVMAVAAALAFTVGVSRYASHVESNRAAAVAAVSLGGVTAVEGVVTLVRKAEPSVVSQSSLEAGDRVATAENARAEMRLGALVVANLGASSSLAVTKPHDATQRLRLDRGRIDAKVDDRPSDLPKLVVETPDVEVVVTGTVFRVDVGSEGSAASATTVSVTKGRVLVRRNGAVVATVNGGESWWSGAKANEAAPPIQEEITAPAKPEPVRNAAPPRARERAGEHAATDGAGTLAEENRLFQKAVEARNRGDFYGALDRLDDLLTRYPASPLASEARLERMRALARLGRAKEASAVARDYLSDSPSGAAKAEAEKVVGSGAPRD